MRISDWSSDVCSSDLALHGRSREPASCIAVITTTVALALDHARTLSAVPGLERSRALTGDLKGRDRDDLLNEFRRGEIPILLLSPEIALGAARSEEHTSELQSLMRISYAVFCLKKKKKTHKK